MAQFLNMSSVMMCPHGGQVNPVTQNARAQAGGGFILRMSDTFLIAGCPFVLGAAPHPCMRVQWVSASASTKVTGDSALTMQSVGLCMAADGAPQGTVLINSTQAQVSGT